MVALAKPNKEPRPYEKCVAGKIKNEKNRSGNRLFLKAIFAEKYKANAK
jgi:hypothetical protein